MSQNINPYYTNPRDDVLELIPSSISKVLDIGCSIGALGENIKRRSNVEVVGIEIDEEMANAARENLDSVIVADIEKTNLSDYFPLNYFDCIIFADVLEHLKNPWDVLKSVTYFLSNAGTIIASIPNVAHWCTIYTVWVRKTWPRNLGGIHDKSHLRWFTISDAVTMLTKCGLDIEVMKKKIRLFDKPNRWNRSGIQKLPHLILGDLLVYQMLFRARKHDRPDLARIK